MVFLGWRIGNRSYWWGDHNPLNLIFVCSLHCIHCSIDCWLYDLILVLRWCQGIRWSSVNNVLCPFNGFKHALLVHQVSLYKLKLVIQLLSIGLDQWLQLCWVLGGPDCSTNLETAVLQERETHLRSNVSWDAGDYHNWFTFHLNCGWNKINNKL